VLALPFVSPLPFPVAGLHVPMPAYLHPSFGDPDFTGTCSHPTTADPDVVLPLPAPISGSPDVADTRRRHDFNPWRRRRHTNTYIQADLGIADRR
jgi:hypothetical protein